MAGANDFAALDAALGADNSDESVAIASSPRRKRMHVHGCGRLADDAISVPRWYAERRLGYHPATCLEAADE